MSIPPLAGNIKVFKTADRNRQAFCCDCAILTVLSSPNPATEGRCRHGRNDYFDFGDRRRWYNMSLYHQMARRRGPMTISRKKTPEKGAPGFSLCADMARLFRLSDDIISYAKMDSNILWNK